MKTIEFDVLIVGAGISGISAAYYLQKECPTKSYTILEGRERIGGTWDLFQYPGIRSDSDMYTLGFAFKPWTKPKAIADGPSILKYLHETIEEFGIDKHIRMNQHVEKASWDSNSNRWVLSITDKRTGEQVRYSGKFLSMCSGYYNYEGGYTPDYPGIDKYKGELVHPQKWTSDIDYKDKKVVVIGSGATAVTLIPELAKEASHVMMLQRSPTYIVSAPSEDKISKLSNQILPSKWAYELSRWRKILFQRFQYALARKYPKFIKGAIIKNVQKELGDDYDVAKHFTPNYNPWDQRICLVPDGDLFTAIKSGDASVVTDHIEGFEEKGIRLKSGDVLEADLVVSATGLRMHFCSGIKFDIDGDVIDFSDKVTYKSMMLSDVPNLVLAFGYTNASWTLKCDLSNQYVCRMINYLDAHGYQSVRPVLSDPTVEMMPWLDFTSGYIQRYIHKLPKTGSKGPWRLFHNYLFDRKMIKRGKIEDDALVFT